MAETAELSERELDILRLVATGASNKEIAQKLFISSNTVKVHLRNIFSKINATSRTEAAMYAVRIGLVDNASSPFPSKDEVLDGSSSAEITLDTLGIPQEEVSNPKLTQKQLVLRFIGVFLSVLLLVTGSWYIRNNVLENNPPIPPTPTQRIQWFSLPGLPSPRKGLAVVSYENVIYAIGGESALEVSSTVERFDPKNSLWSTLTPKPTPVTDINAAIIGGLIYIPGGRLSSGMPTNITEIYDPSLDQWTNGPPLPKALSAYSLAVYEGKIYLFGGWDGQNVIDDVYVFDPHDNSWSEVSNMPTARSFSGAVFVAGKIYVIGGLDGKNALNVTEVFHPDITEPDKQWSAAPSLPSGRYGMGVTNVADMIFVIGGENSSDNLKSIVLIQGANEWSKLDSPIENGWFFLNTVSLGSRLYALGGTTEQGYVDQMWSYQAFYMITLPIVR